MTPAEKMDEIVRALEALDPYVEFGDYRDERDYNDAVERFKAALTLARELRDNAVEVRAEAVEPDDTACSCAKARSYEVHHACGHVYKIGDPALLITDPTP